ncbi:probable inactive shikimate kinase like 1, chloroplastic isoform X1 [Dioscorea cayenensis subsp. rotundata]|uniref:Probable inactive shikimate kinase like 1, chloroplastic isoform X1 n=2 Tax=Dioscorea cayennensis subsp. rotundata TaxID=55577 RepID=A0AB40B8D0_DIOCR|nr:probable inactive shikimate kinase like 1, chloroplastic isoform X1 [Dioscorea cayenensis subsp. rotundata]
MAPFAVGSAAFGSYLTSAPQLTACTSRLCHPISSCLYLRNNGRPRRGTACRRAGSLSLGARMSAAELETSLAVKKMATEISFGLKGTSIFLVGINCSMKTNVGKVLADALRYYYFDSDSVVEEASGGESSATSFLERDEKGFRESETEVLKQLSSMGRLVVCAGDGAVQSPQNLSYLRYGISVWIDVPLDLLADEMVGAQVPSASDQSMSQSDPFQEALEGLTKRYMAVSGGYGTADATASLLKVTTKLGYDDFKSVTPEDMAIEAMTEIEKLTRVKKMIEAAAKPF